MRIAVLSVHTSPLARPGGAKAGGLNVYVLQLARQLVAQGCSVDVFSRSTLPDLPEVIEIEPGLRAVHVAAGPVAPLAPEAIYGHLDTFVEGVKAFASRDTTQRDEPTAARPYDIIHSHYWLSGLAGERLKTSWGVPHVTMFHTLGEIKNRSSVQEHESELRIASERAVLQGAERVICATEQERAAIRALYGADLDKVTVIPLGVDMDRFRPAAKIDARRRLGLSEDERIILFVGRLEPLKGVDILIGAASMLDSDVDCSVLIVGGDETSAAQVSQLQDLAHTLGVGERVAFAGAVDHEMLPLYYNAADICVVPSHYESFGLVAIEAMASGVPVVASRVGGLTGTVRDGETGYLIPWLCPEPFAERIELLLDNEPLRISLGEAAREAVARYRWENVAGAVLEVYEALLGVQRQAVSTPA
jgi:D-inositol-3-phosphate glycosyltransferase